MPKQFLELGRPGGEESLLLSTVEFIQVEMARGCWSPCLVLGDRAVLVLSTMVVMATWEQTGEE